MRSACLLLVALTLTAGCRRERAPAPTIQAVLSDHPVRLDAEGKILSWIEAPAPYAEVVRLGFSALETKFPTQANGKPTFYAHSRFDPSTFAGDGWVHNPAGLNAMIAESALRWYAFSGDDKAVELARGLLDHQIAHGSTPMKGAWPGVPYASSDAGATEWSGADDAFCERCGIGDGRGVIEPDKVGELGLAYLQMWEHTGDAKYRDAALRCADALAKNVRNGDETHSPWPFRVHAETGEVREEYTAHVIAPIALFDELLRLGIGDVVRYTEARTTAWTWLRTHPLENDAWAQYFEDIAIQKNPLENTNQYAPLMTARYLLDHPDKDPDLERHVARIVEFVAKTFAVDTTNGEKGVQFGAEVLSEQRVDMWKMGSHTARWGAVLALWHERTGDAAARERAFRSLNWATYLCDEKGVIGAALKRSEGYWFSDGYGDYLRHFLVAMGAVPDWAPNDAPRLLRSTSVVRKVDRTNDRLAYETFDGTARDVVRAPKPPKKITVDGVELPKPSYRVVQSAAGGVVVRIARTTGRSVVLAF